MPTTSLRDNRKARGGVHGSMLRDMTCGVRKAGGGMREMEKEGN